MKTVKLLLVMVLSAGLAFGQSSLMTLLNDKATREQVLFLSSGTFTPSANLLALGGWVDVIAVGGGGGGGNSDSSHAGMGGGGGKVVHLMAQISGAVTVTIGAGGAAQAVGGTTTFGSYITASGGMAGIKAPTSSSTYDVLPGGLGSNGAGTPAFASVSVVLSGSGGPCLLGYGGGGGSGLGTDYGSGASQGSCGAGAGALWNTNGTAAGANTGGGGGGASGASYTGGAGGSGILIVSWFE